MQEEIQRRHPCDPAPVFFRGKFMIRLGIILQEEDHPDRLGKDQRGSPVDFLHFIQSVLGHLEDGLPVTEIHRPRWDRF